MVSAQYSGCKANQIHSHHMPQCLFIQWTHTWTSVTSCSSIILKSKAVFSALLPVLGTAIFSRSEPFELNLHPNYCRISPFCYTSPTLSKKSSRSLYLKGCYQQHADLNARASVLSAENVQPHVWLHSVPQHTLIILLILCVFYCFLLCLYSYLLCHFATLVVVYLHF